MQKSGKYILVATYNVVFKVTQGIYKDVTQIIHVKTHENPLQLDSTKPLRRCRRSYIFVSRRKCRSTTFSDNNILSCRHDYQFL